MKNELKINAFKPSVCRNRRDFIKLSGLALAGTGLLLAGCSDDDDDNNPPQTNYPGMRDGVFDFGSGDIGILTYAYALEQLEAAFYTQVVASPFTGITALETQYMQEIRDHEIAHREFFKAALGNDAIPALEVDFSSINFTSRDSVLGTAKAFEDLGIPSLLEILV